MKNIIGILVVSSLLIQSCSTVIVKVKEPVEKVAHHEEYEESVNGLKLSIRSLKAVYEENDEIIFLITFENVGEKDFVLNLGEMLGNGTQIPSKLKFSLTDEDGNKTDFTYHGRVAGVSGSLDFFGIPLKTGTQHTLKISIKDFTYNPIPDGIYKMTCLYKGSQTEFRNPTFVKFWEGNIVSDEIELKINE